MAYMVPYLSLTLIQRNTSHQNSIFATCWTLGMCLSPTEDEAHRSSETDALHSNQITEDIMVDKL